MIYVEHALERLALVLVAWIAKAGYWGIFASMALESANIPIPSEIVMPFSGYLVFDGRFSFFWVVMAGTIGNLAGSLASYALGFWGGRPFVERYGSYIRITLADLERGEGWMVRWGNGVVFFSRLLPVVRTFISLPAGVLRMNVWKFSLYTFAGALPWNYALTYAGVIAGKNWDLLQSSFRAFDWVILGGIIAVGAWWFFRRRSR
ncbi:MAG: DedA family protein [Candidatus Wildermuthbacteria bacterium]|nr:DedA family protein [Candidatus Wildermuthbacteria bacterium]